ncbi:hypothetical protein Tco_0976843 [Tanacetum coccineum]|uniref:Reverse transcriptase Ty1/copia-type domain-containing protein n=1 Tax=Tanacetum coccineum TaxID=301880 RepID=A0ABQ5EIF1_9ASTR
MMHPSPSNSQTIKHRTYLPVTPNNNVEEDNYEMKCTYGNVAYFGIPIPEIPSDQSSSSDYIHKIVHPDHQISKHNSKWTKDHPLENIIGELDRPVSTRLTQDYKDALTQSCWIEAMQEELNEFKRLEVWELISRPDKVMVITLKWIYKVKLYELGGKEGEETEGRGKLKRGKLARARSTFASFQIRGYQFFCLCCSHEHGRLPTWMSRLHFSKGSVNPTLFIRKKGKELLLVQVYVDDIIFAASTPKLCDLFAKIIGIFINQSKYTLESLKKYDFDSFDPVDTPIVEKSKLDEDKKRKAVDPSPYRGMIGTLLYLTANFVTESSKRQKSTAISSTEAEYIAMSKHIDIRFHFIKEHVENVVIELYFVNTEYQLVDIITKPLCRERIEFLINKLGMRSFTPETLKKLANEVEE